MELPAWVALTLTVPAPVKVRVEFATEAGPESRAKETGSAELAVALSETDPTLNFTGAIAAKLIVWALVPTALVDGGFVTTGLVTGLVPPVFVKVASRS